MTALKEKAAPEGTGTALSAANYGRNSTATDPMKGWFDLASNVKPSRNRQQKKLWNRGRK